MNLKRTQNVQLCLDPSVALGSSTRTACDQISNPADLRPGLNEKMCEQAERTSVREHCEYIFSFNLGQK